MPNSKNVAAIVNTLVAEYEAADSREALQKIADRAFDYRSGLDSRERGILAEAFMDADTRIPSAPIVPLVSFG